MRLKTPHPSFASQNPPSPLEKALGENRFLKFLSFCKTKPFDKSKFEANNLEFVEQVFTRIYVTNIRRNVILSASELSGRRAYANRAESEERSDDGISD